MKTKLTISFLLVFLLAQLASAQTSTITYQGKLSDAGAPANGTYDFEFRLFDFTIQVAPQVTVNDVVVTKGNFTVQLDFGSTAFPGADRFLEIRVRPGDSTDPDAYTTLSPRQRITSSPYSMRSLSADLAATAETANALSAACNSCVTSSQIASIDGSKVTGTLSADGSGLTNVPGTIAWHVTNNTSQQAQPNSGYIGTSSERMTITLPVNPSIGDILRVSGLGFGGWKIAQNDNQAIVDTNLYSVHLWAAHETNRSWTSIASSADGVKLVAVAGSDQIFTSTDSGVSWIARETARNWTSVASSKDGTKLVAVVSGGQIYTSINSGVSWTPRDSARSWAGVASSADGVKLVAIVSGGQIYTSADSGLSWLPHLGNSPWKSVTTSADGNKIAAALYDGVAPGGNVFVSVDGGETWTLSAPILRLTSVACSADCSKLVAGQDLGTLFVSTNLGASWTPTGPVNTWSSIASSADGRNLVAAQSSDFIYTSNDGGLTWIRWDASRFWRSVACSADGTPVAVAFGGQIYTYKASTTVGPSGYLLGGRATSIELVYTGNGLFLPLSHEGTITGQ